MAHQGKETQVKMGLTDTSLKSSVAYWDTQINNYISAGRQVSGK